MSDELDISPGGLSEEMAAYLQMFLDETSEQLDGLVETLLVLEGDPSSREHLNEAFRLIHSIKGSSAMMGLDSITVLTHHLENYFERLRSGVQSLDQSIMDLILKCIDFLRECTRRLRDGEPLASAPELLQEVGQLTHQVPEKPLSEVKPASAPVAHAEPRSEPEEPVRPPAATISTVNDEPPVDAGPPPDVDFRVTVHFEPDLQLIDLKAELVLSRLGELGMVLGSDPHRERLDEVQRTKRLQIIISSHRAPIELRTVADISGVTVVEIEEGERELVRLPSSAASTPILTADDFAARPMSSVESAFVEYAPESHAPQASSEPQARPTERSPTKAGAAGETMTNSRGGSVAAGRDVAAADAGDSHEPVEETPARESVPGTAGESSKSRVIDTVRVDIDRLDNLMNLAGELIVNKARFAQIARQMSPAFKKSTVSGRARAFAETLRRVFQMMSSQEGQELVGQAPDWAVHLRELELELDLLEEQSKLWEDSRRYFGQISEAIDQLTRVSANLQRGVLDTRMVPVAPLFNRFKRVVRDIAHELGKKVVLEIHGEKTELDKRMIDELGDPLVHLVRNAIDHGIESPELRHRRGKPETGTLRLEAAHSGNNVFISIRDDGGGINTAKVRERIVSRGLLTAAAVDELTDRDVIEFIWHPGFSTAEVVSDISGRGVGMDIVKTRIAELNGMIEIDHIPGQGTTFTIRLPLTLAIIRSLLFRVQYGVFAVPIDNVREIVSVGLSEILTIRGRQTFEVRGEFIPLIDIDDLFRWHHVEYRSHSAKTGAAADGNPRRVDVVILHSAGKAIGLKVDELHGGQDIVIKSLAENFVHIRGLSGASILGDGSVCLLMDVAASIDMAAELKKQNGHLDRELQPA